MDCQYSSHECFAAVSGVFAPTVEWSEAWSSYATITETTILHVGGRILDESTVSGHLFVAAKRTLTAPQLHFCISSVQLSLSHICPHLSHQFLPQHGCLLSFFFWSDQHRHTRDSVSRIAMAPGSCRVAASIHIHTLRFSYTPQSGGNTRDAPFTPGPHRARGWRSKCGTTTCCQT